MEKSYKIVFSFQNRYFINIWIFLTARVSNLFHRFFYSGVSDHTPRQVLTPPSFDLLHVEGPERKASVLKASCFLNSLDNLSCTADPPASGGRNKAEKTGMIMRRKTYTSHFLNATPYTKAVNKTSDGEEGAAL